MITRDVRFLEALQRQDPDFVTFLGVADAAAALRACRTEPVSWVVLDGALPETVRTEFLRWWQAGLDRRALPLQLAGGDNTATLTVTAIVTPADAAAPQALGHVLPRDGCGVARELADRTACWLDAERQELRGPQGVVALTVTEAALLRTLVLASGVAPSADLARVALGHADGAALAALRTHVANLRRKSRDVGLDGLVRILARRGYVVDVVALRTGGPGGAARYQNGVLAERRGNHIPNRVQSLNRGETVQPFGPVQRVLL